MSCDYLTHYGLGYLTHKVSACYICHVGGVLQPPSMRKADIEHIFRDGFEGVLALTFPRTADAKPKQINAETTRIDACSAA